MSMLTKGRRGVVLLFALFLCISIFFMYTRSDNPPTVFSGHTLDADTRSPVPVTTSTTLPPFVRPRIRHRQDSNVNKFKKNPMSVVAREENVDIQYNGPDNRLPALQKMALKNVIPKTKLVLQWIQELRGLYRYWMRNVSLRYDGFPTENWTTSWPNYHTRTICSGNDSEGCYRVVSEITISPNLLHTLSLKRATKELCLESCTKMSLGGNESSTRCIAASFNHLSQCVLATGNISSIPPLSIGVSGDDVYIPLAIWSNDEEEDLSPPQGSCAKRVPLRLLSRHHTKGGTPKEPSHALFSMLTTVAYIRDRVLVTLGSYLYPYPVLIFFNDHGEEDNQRIRKFMRPLTHPSANSSFCLEPVCPGAMGERQVLFAKVPTDRRLRGYGGGWKNYPILEHLYRGIQQAAQEPFSVYHARWFFFVDDDTYMIPRNLELILASFYLHDAYYQNVRLHIGFNHETHKKDPGFIHGGAGIMLSREAIRAIGAPKAITDCNMKCGDIPHGDVRMTCCSRRWNVTVIGAGGFYYETPFSAIKTRFFKLWLWHNHVPFPLSFHRTNDTIEMHVISQFAAAHAQDTCDEPQFISWWPFRARYSAFEEGTDNRKK